MTGLHIKKVPYVFDPINWCALNELSSNFPMASRQLNMCKTIERKVSPLLLGLPKEEEEERCFSEPLSTEKKKAEINNKFNEILNEAIFIEFIFLLCRETKKVFNILVQCKDTTKRASVT